MPEPSSPELPAVTRTETTLGSTVRATATQSGPGAPFVTRGDEAPVEEPPEPLAEPPLLNDDEDVAAELSRASVMPRVNRLDSTAAAAPTATTPPQPGPRRADRVWSRCGTGGSYGGWPCQGEVGAPKGPGGCAGRSRGEPGGA